MRAVRSFSIGTNTFKGTLPNGIRKMSTVIKFFITINSFDGALPGSGLQALRAVTDFTISKNALKGTIPES
eukprot:4775859-Amphidinium_carterae.1